MTKSLSETPADPRLTVVIVLYDMAREAKRSLHALSAAHQAGVSAADYEVIVVENGSADPVTRAQVESFGENFRYLGIAPGDALPSPCAAVNRGVAMARAPFLGIMIDGARIASPGAIALALSALERFDRAVVATIGLHLGPAMQTRAAETGYDQDVEDELLASVDWRTNGYRLFEISVLTGVNSYGWLGPMGESNLLFLSREMYDQIGGFDPRFDIPGGGLVNLDFYNRATEREGTTLISLFGEATFHQIHGGVMSSNPAETVPQQVEIYKDQFRAIRGVPFTFSQRVPMLMGSPRPETYKCLAETCGKP